MKIYAVRHGQTIFNVLDKVQGWADTPLTEKGIADGQSAGQRLAHVKFDAAYASDTSRAIHTAEFILQENQYRQPRLDFTPDWREYYFGSFEGGDNAVMWGSVSRYFDMDTVKSDDIALAHNMTEIMDVRQQVDPQRMGENAEIFWQRMRASLRHLQDHNTTDATILLVSHGQLIWNLAQYFGHFKEAKRPQNGSVAVFDLNDNGELRVEHFNDLTTTF